ncbi:MAG: hypothetical protein Q8O55_07555 [Dehalococcoidales bacterium]|nr:hypothetical protein [Dehalococcoidales bacterium]
MKIPSGLFLDNPAWPLLQAHISYFGTTTAAGNAGGTSLICAGLALEPSYDGLSVKILTGGAAGQVRTIQIHGGATILVGVGFTDSAGAAQLIAAGTGFVILSSMAGGGGPGPSPEESLTYYGIVDAVPGANQFTISGLAGLGAGKFAGATNPYQAFVLRDAGGASAAPQGQLQAITAYTTATGVFATPAFTAAIAVGDEVLIIHPSLAAAILGGGIVASGVFDTSSATVPADSTRAEGNQYFRGHLLVPLTGAQAQRATRIVDYTGVGGIFTVDPSNPFTAATGLVSYVVIRDQTEFAPAAGYGNSRTPSDVIGTKTDGPNFNTDNASIIYSLMSWLRGVARAEMVLTGNAEAGSTASNIVSVASLNQAAGYWIGQSVLMVDGNNIRLVRPIVAYNAGTNTITVSPAFPAAVAAPDQFVILSGYHDPLAVADAATNLKPSDVIGNKADAAVTAVGAVASIIAYIKGILLGIAAAAHGFQEQASVAVNITAILAAETNVFNLATAVTRYQVRSLRLKCADPGANTVTVRLYSLINAVSTVVATFTITGTNFGSYHSLMDMFGVPHLAGDNIKITVQATAAGPFAVTGQYSYATAT